MNGKARRSMLDLAAYLVVRLLVCIVQAAPPRLAYALADAMARLVHACIRRRRETARENIQAAFPELSPAAVDRLVFEMYRHFARSFLEVMLIARKLRRSTLNQYIAFPDEAFLGSLFQSNRAVLIVTAHFGNWELAGLAFGLLGYHTSAIARVLDNPYLERYTLRFRQSTGQRIIAKQDDFEKLDGILAAGGNVATVADQDAGRRGLFVDFFGRPASTHKAVALLAMKYDAVMVVGGVPRVNRADYHPNEPHRTDGLDPMFYSFTIDEVIDPREYKSMGRAAAVKAITERYSNSLERLIRKYPEQYFWLHRRWKSQPPAKLNQSQAA